MKFLEARNAFDQLVADLTPRYGAGEAHSISKIVFEDAFRIRPAAAQPFPASAEALFFNIQQRLLRGEPVQYVLGQADFFGLKFKVDPSVLIPRQETEELVIWALKWLRNEAPDNPAVADIGLGSACIALALKTKRPDIQLFGIEKSPEALRVATENARELIGEQQFAFFCGDILNENDWANFPALDMVISNPPYIPRQEQELMPEHVLAWEPELALFVDDPDALLFYRAIARFALKKLKSGGALFFECNEFNASEVATLLQNLGFSAVELRKDISGADRMLMGRALPLQHV